MFLNILIWGVQFMVMKDALNDFAPLTFTAVRFTIGLPFIAVIAFGKLSMLRIARGDILPLVGFSLLGQLGYQVFSMLSLQYTTSTNTALMVATIPTWTALLSLVLGIILVRRQLLAGVALSLLGVIMVIVADSSEGLALSSGDVLGIGLALAAAIVTAIFAIGIKSLIDRYGATAISIWMYIITWLSLQMLAWPDLRTLTTQDFPPSVWPNLAYTGILAGALGFLIEGYALKKLGPARMSNYYNITPIIAAMAGVIALHEPLTPALVIGGLVTLAGVMIVRRHTLLRPTAEEQQAEGVRVPQMEAAL